MTQFKDKASRQKKNINSGLFTYPVLQAADILLYHPTHIPVGEDQVQHVELTRNIARWFNKRYTTYFSEPEALLTETPRVKSLLDPQKKMSKSLGDNHVIALQDEPDVIEKKVKKAVTASDGGKDAPGVDNLLMLLEKFGDKKDVKAFVAAQKDGSIRYGDLKAAVAATVSEYFAPFRTTRAALLADHDAIAEILISGAQKAHTIAEQTMEDVRKIVGIR